MPVINASDVADDDPVGVPLIGWDNLVTATNIDTTTEATGFPATNMANPSTYLKWRGEVTTGNEYITVSNLFGSDVNYIGIAGHNFGSGAIPVIVEGLDPSHVLLHFDRDGSSPDVIVDDNSVGSTHTWTASGNANESTVQFRFGDSSLSCDGSGDFISTADSADFTLGTFDFTIDGWFYRSGGDGTVRHIWAHGNGTGGNTSFLVQLDSTNKVRVQVYNNGAAQVTIDSTTTYTTTGWHHFAFVRSGSSFMLFVDGVQEGVTTTYSGDIFDSTANMQVGADGGSSSTWNGFLDELRLLVGYARWTSAFTPPSSPSGWSELAVAASEEDSYNILLHCDGTDGSTTIVDDHNVGVDHVWQVNGNAQIDTGTKKFGTGALLLDGVGDRILLTTDPEDLEPGSGDFTVDFWMSPAAANSPDVNQCLIAKPATWQVFFSNARVTAALFNEDFGSVSLQGTSALTPSVWHHVAFVRDGNTIRLFVNGVQEDSDTFTGATSNTANTITIGSDGSNHYNGSMDEIRYSVGFARWTSAFSVPTSATSPASLITDDSPIIFRWTTTPLAGVRLLLKPETTSPEAAVVYAGELLVLERSIDINVDHVPVTYGRRSNIVNGMSETGNFLGRIVLGEHRASKAEFKWFTPTFYRENIDPFLEAAQESPFFWAWSPDEYPAEVGYVWLTNNAEPETDPVTRRVHLDIEMRGVA